MHINKIKCHISFVVNKENAVMFHLLSSDFVEDYYVWNQHSEQESNYG